MSQPMLTVSSSNTAKKKVQVNLLPCRIHHDGYLDTVKPYWTPAQSNNGTRTAYVRGRKLHGKTVKLPEGYYGSVVERGETRAEVEETNGDTAIEELPEAVEVAPLSSKANFDDFVIWGHEATADAGDPYLRSIDEWVSFSEQLHSYASLDTTSK